MIPCDQPVSPVCPDDLGKLEFAGAELSCYRCHRRFPSAGGVTELMPQEVFCESSSESKQLNAYEASFSERPDRGWKQPLRVFLHKLGNGYLHSWAAKRLEEIGQGRSLTVLDAGCGDGILKSYLSRRHTYVGVDFSIRPLVRARRYYPGTYFRADLNHLPFPDNSFDAVLSFQALQYLVRPQTALAQIARVLKPGGRLLLSVPNNESVKYRIEGVPRIQLQRFDRGSVPALLKEHFSDLQMQPQGVWVPVPLTSLHAPGKYSARWGLSWTVVAMRRK